MTSVVGFREPACAQPIQMLLQEGPLYVQTSRHDADVAVPPGLPRKHVDQNAQRYAAQRIFCFHMDLRAEVFLQAFEMSDLLLERFDVPDRTVAGVCRLSRVRYSRT
jgi:hypothetical protein